MNVIKMVARLMMVSAGLLVVLIGLAWIGALGWRAYGPKKPQPNEIRRVLVARAVPEIVHDIRQQLTNSSPALLLQLANDPTDFVTDSLRSGLEGAGVAGLVPVTPQEQLGRWLNLNIPAPSSPEEAAREARNQRAQTAIYGRVLDFGGTTVEARMSVEVSLVDAASGETVFTKTYAQNHKSGQVETARPGVNPTATKASSSLLPPWSDGFKTSGQWRWFLGWAMAVILLPVLCVQFVREAVKKKSNSANVAALGTLTAVDAILACLLMDLSPGLSVGGLAFLALILGAFTYNVWIMTRVLEMETDLTVVARNR